jgi:hypothetical protein
MIEAPRLFGPKIAKRKPVPNDTPKLAVDSLGEEAAHVSGKDSEIAELNAQRVGQVLKRALRRSKQSRRRAGTPIARPGGRCGDGPPEGGKGLA